MLAKMMKKACALTVAMLLVVSGALMGAQADDDYVVEIVGAEPTENTTPAQDQSDSVIIDYAEPAQSTQNTVTPSTSGSTSEGSSDTTGDAEKPMYRVDFYSHLGEFLGGVDICEGDYIIEPESEPYTPQGQMFLFWYDESEVLLAPYVFGSPVTKSMSLVPYFVSLPQAGDSSSQFVTMTPEQTTQVVQEIIAAQQIINELPTAPEQTTMTPDEVNQIVDDILIANREAGENSQPSQQVMTDDQTNAIIDDILAQTNPAEATNDEPVATQAPAPAQDQNAIIDEIFANQNQGQEQTQTPAPQPETPMTDEQTLNVIDDILSGNDQNVVVDEPTPEPEPTVEADANTGTTNPQTLIDAILAGEDINNLQLGEDAQGVVVDSHLTAPTQEPDTQPVVTSQPEEDKNVAMTGQQVDNLIADIIGDMLQPPPVVSEPETPTDETDETDDTSDVTEPVTDETDDTSDVTEPVTDETDGEPVETDTDTNEETPGEEGDGTEGETTGEDELTEEGEEPAEEGDGTEGETTGEDELTEEGEEPGEEGDGTEDETTGEDELTEEGEEPAEEGDGTEDETAGEDELTEEGEEPAEEGDGTEDEATGEDELTEEGEEPAEDELEVEGEPTEEGDGTEDETAGEDELTEEGDGTEETEEEIPVEEPVVPNDYRYDTSRMSVDVTMAALREGENVPEGEVVFGDIIEMRGFPVNPDGVPFTMQWQRDTGSGWEAIEGETGQNYSFVITEENVNWNYRLVLDVDQPAEPTAEGEGEGEADAPAEEEPAVDEALAAPVDEAVIVGEESTTE